MPSPAEEVLDRSLPLDARIRALYALKQQKDEAAARVLLDAIRTTDSVLYQHEIIYNIGQFGFAFTVPALGDVLEDRSFDVVSRHEAIEAMGAIADASALPVLSKYAADASESAPIRESCDLAIERIQRIAAISGDRRALQSSTTHFVSVDPAPAFREQKSVAELSECLLDASKPLFERYQAMFSLRDMGSEEAVRALCRGLRQDTSSCLFRHEIAFVLGQLEHVASVEALIEALKDEAEHEMVRHESAEALGAIATAETWPVLQQYATHQSRLVQDSCQVALEMHKYWSQFRK
jgi:deoxyhypusine monooxygenase